MTSKIPWTKADIDRLLQDNGLDSQPADLDSTEGMRQLHDALIGALQSVPNDQAESDREVRKNIDALLDEVFPTEPVHLRKSSARRWQLLAAVCAMAACLAVAFYVYTGRDDTTNVLLASVYEDFDRGEFRLAQERITRSSQDNLSADAHAKLSAALRIAKRQTLARQQAPGTEDPWQLPAMSPNELIAKGATDEQFIADLNILRDSRWAQFALGIQFLEGGRDVDAFEHFGNMVRRYPNDAAMWGARGVAAARCGRNQEARTSLERALVLRPNDPELQSYLEEVLRSETSQQ